MDQTGDRQPPGDDEQDFLPTEIVRANPPAQAPPGYQPEQAPPGYQPTARGPDYQPTVGGPDYRPTVGGPDYQPTVGGPGYQPTQSPPGYRPGQGGPGYQPGQRGPGYQPGQGGPTYQPGQGGPGYQPGQGGPGYSPTQGGPGYRPSHAGPADEATVVGPSYTPTHARPADWQAQAGPSYSQTEAGPSYTPTQAGPARDVPSQGGTTQPGLAYQQTQGPGYPPPPPGGRGFPPPPGGGGAQGDPANSELMRYGPGVPATPPPGTSQTAERIWRTGRPEEPARRPRRWRGLAGAALTVILLAASGVVLYLRFHHAPFHVTAVKITQQTRNGCGVNVTGKIDTNGSAGTVSYQWLFQPDSHAPQPLSQSVVAGQDAVFVTVAVQGSGHGSASRKVTLQVLGPDKRAASTSVVLQC